MNTRQIYHVCVLIVILATSSSASAQDAADADYSAELKRIPPTEPADALKTFEVVPGYKLELVAAEPLVTSPVAASFDEDGRLFVVEMRDYSEQDKEKLGRVRLLTDTDGNGTFDKSLIFAEGLSWPTAIITYEGGVFVGAAPDIWYLKDTDHDGKADVQRKVFTGFGRGNVQGLLNSFQWGLDNRIHVAVSSAGAALQYVNDQGEPQGKPLTLRGRDFSFDPRKPEDFIATSGGGQHGMSFDDWGRKFVCSNSDHIQLIMLEDADLARNPYYAAPSPRISIAVDGPQADVFRISPVEPWREVRTRLRVKGLVPGPIEGGGRAAGYFTGATGITIYRGNAWPKEDRGLAIVGDVGGNLIHRKRLEPHGLELRAKRIDEKREFIASRDNWFRPVQFLNAPDGALYVLDMYRETIEHPASLPPAIKKHLDLTSGRDRGRIYRIVPDKFEQPPLPNLSKATTAELVALLEHENGWHRDAAQRLLYERDARTTIAAMQQLNSKEPRATLHVHSLLAAWEALPAAQQLAALRSESPYLRRYAIRLIRQQTMVAPTIRQALCAAVQDDDASVRCEAALALGRFSDEARTDALAELAIRAGQNRWTQAALLSSLATGAGDVLARLMAEPQSKSEGGQAMIAALASQIGRQQREDDVAALLQAIAKLPQEQANVLPLVLKSLNLNAEHPLQRRLAQATNGKADELLAEIVAKAGEVCNDPNASVADRLAAISTLRRGALKPATARLLPCVASTQPHEVQQAAISVIASFDDAATNQRLLAQWLELGPSVRRHLLETLLARKQGRWALVASLESKQLAVAELQAQQIQSLMDDPATVERLQPLVTAMPSSPRVEVVQAFQSSLTLATDKTRGAELFKKQCSTCHKLGEVGHEIGPNLAAMKARGREAILVNVLDPNREVNPQFVTYSVTTKEGRVLSGMIAAETATSLTLKRAENQQDVVLRIDIEELKSTGQSLMPEGLEKQLDKQQLADVIEFIMSQ